ncbi:hypothetical protein Nepgr_004279 [Nepenthes gracilis]|uniref:Uncharacterized protein n=1 Tax=Nepenthes gracilis TaxID=150966 RepID=A0AAD3S119_NEPGR|nr:hypothetical protein Nepgr_004279 [Nepenthes gracilis]
MVAPALVLYCGGAEKLSAYSNHLEFKRAAQSIAAAPACRPLYPASRPLHLPNQPLAVLDSLPLIQSTPPPPFDQHSSTASPPPWTVQLAAHLLRFSAAADPSSLTDKFVYTEACNIEGFPYHSPDFERP